MLSQRRQNEAYHNRLCGGEMNLIDTQSYLLQSMPSCGTHSSAPERYLTPYPAALVVPVAVLIWILLSTAERQQKSVSLLSPNWWNAHLPCSLWCITVHHWLHSLSMQVYADYLHNLPCHQALCKMAHIQSIHIQTAWLVDICSQQRTVACPTGAPVLLILLDTSM